MTQTIAAQSPLRVKSVVVPILMACLGYASYNFSDAGCKALLEQYHISTVQVMLVASAVSIVFMTVYGWFREGKKSFRTNKPKLLLTRALLAQVNSVCNLLAFPHIHLTVFYTLIFTSPFWVALLSIVVMKEKADKRRIGVILFGFAVVMYIFHPGSGLFNVWSGLILLSAFAFACQLLIIRRIGPHESRALMINYGSVMNILIAVPFLGRHYVPLTAEEWLSFCGIGLAGCIGLLCISYAFQEASSSAVVAPCHYTQILWGAALGYYLFHEVPGMQTLVGAALLILSGVYLVRHERRRTMLKVGV